MKEWNTEELKTIHRLTKWVELTGQPHDNHYIVESWGSYVRIGEVLTFVKTHDKHHPYRLELGERGTTVLITNDLKQITQYIVYNTLNIFSLSANDNLWYPKGEDLSYNYKLTKVAT